MNQISMPVNKKLAIRNKNSGVDTAFVLLVIFFFFEFLRPQDSFIGFLAIFRIPTLLTIALAIIAYKSDKKMLADKLSVLALVFLLDMGLSVLYATNTYAVFNIFRSTALIVIIILAIPIVIDSMDKFIKFIGTWVSIHAVLALYAVLHSGHGPGGFLLDENDLALTLVMAIPLAAIMAYQKKLPKNKKILFLGITVMLVAGVVASMSRGGFLGLSSIGLVFWWLSKNKFSMLVKGLIVIAILGYPVYEMVPEEYTVEMMTISDTQDATRTGRLFSWGLAWDMFLDNPVLGVGARNYGWDVVKYQIKAEGYNPDARLLGGRVAHSLYLTLLSETGIVGTIIYLLIVLLVIKKLRRIIKLSKDEKFYAAALFATALMVSLVAFFITGAFLSVLYYPSFWYLLGFVLALESIVNNMQTREDESSELDVVQRKSRFRSIIHGPRAGY